MIRRALFVLAATALGAGCASARAPRSTAVVAGAVSTGGGGGSGAAATRTCTTTPLTAGWAEEDDLLFGTCEDFLPEFGGWLERSCKEAAPELVGAYLATIGTTPGAPDESFYGDRRRERRARQFLDAARGRVPAACAGGFPRDEEDFSRAIFEVKPDWRRCPPDEDLFRSFTFDHGDRVTFGAAAIGAGPYFWALALKSHLTPVGRQYLHKFLACEVVASDAVFLHDPAARRRVDTVHTDDP